jgi:hypothetical protein
MKRLLMAILLSAAMPLLACWFTTDSFSGYIAGVNFFQEHMGPEVANAYKNNTVMNVRNGMRTSLPMTVWFYVVPRTMKVNGVNLTAQIRLTRLYYKVIPKNSSDDNTTSVWRLAKEIDMGEPVKWNLDFKANVKLFSNNCITKELILKNGDSISEGDKIIMVWFIADDSVQSVTNGPEITPGQNLPRFTVNDNDPINTAYGGNSITSDYTAPYVMKVVYNGMKTPRR